MLEEEIAENNSSGPPKNEITRWSCCHHKWTSWKELFFSSNQSSSVVTCGTMECQKQEKFLGGDQEILGFIKLGPASKLYNQKLNVIWCCTLRSGVRGENQSLKNGKRKKEETHVQLHTQTERELCPPVSNTWSSVSLVCAIAPSFYFLSFRDCPFPATPPSNSAPVVVICLTVRLLYCLSQLGVPGRSRHVSCLSRNAIPPVHLVNHENVNVWTI